MKCGQIEGKDIYLRLMTGEDTENIIRWRNKEMVLRNFIYQKPFTSKGHENWIKTITNAASVKSAHKNNFLNKDLYT
mgnify:CR=1 FL=1